MTLLSRIELERIFVRPGKDRIALGSGSAGLGVACDFCYPALVTAHVVIDGAPCCHKCAGDLNRHCCMPKFLRRPS